MSRKKLYGLFRYNEDGTLEGYCEGSFSMLWLSTHVRILSKTDVYYYTKSNKMKGYFILRITRQNLPNNMKIRWDMRNDIMKKQYKSGKRIQKWIQRNVPFTQDKVALPMLSICKEPS